LTTGKRYGIKHHFLIRTKPFDQIHAGHPGGLQWEFIRYPLGKFNLRRALQMEIHAERVEVLEEGNGPALMGPMSACCMFQFAFTF
jgi:hypothetical protein